jgi:hypothetical protein
MTYASFFDDTTGILFCILGYFNYFWSYDILKLVMTYLFQVCILPSSSCSHSLKSTMFIVGVFVLCAPYFFISVFVCAIFFHLSVCVRQFFLQYCPVSTSCPASSTTQEPLFCRTFASPFHLLYYAFLSQPIMQTKHNGAK